MKIVVVGGGKVGAILVQELSPQHDIILIDNNTRVVEDLSNAYDIQVIVGNGSDVDILREAGVDDCDMFISVSNSDEINIISCIIARKLGARYTVARVRKPEYHSAYDFIKESLEIDYLVNPEEESSFVLSEILKYPNANGIEHFANGKLNMVEFSVDEDSFLANMTLKDFRESFDGNLLVCIVEREGQVFIPSGNTTIQGDDIIYVTGSIEALNKFYQSINKFNKTIGSTLIIGAGNLSYYLIKKLEKRRLEIKLIEIKKEVCERFAREFPNIQVICADGTDQDVLEDQGIEDYDSCIALTGTDEENIVISIFAKHKKVAKCIAKVNRTSILKLLDMVDLDTTITPKLVIADKIIRLVRSIGATGNSKVERLYRLADRRVEALEFIADCHSKTIGIKLLDLNTLDNTIIAFIIRENQIIIPSGQDEILANDRVIVVTTHEDITDLDDILK